MASLSRPTAARSVAESSVIERDASVAVSMARSARLGWSVDSDVSSDVSMFIRKTHLVCRSRDTVWVRAMRVPPLAIRASAGFEQRVQRPLAIRDRRRVERRVAASLEKCGGENLVPVGQHAPRVLRKDKAYTERVRGGNGRLSAHNYTETRQEVTTNADSGKLVRHPTPGFSSQVRGGRNVFKSRRLLRMEISPAQFPIKISS
jgi:hypothetical protein